MMPPLPYSGDIELETDRREEWLALHSCPDCDGDGYGIYQGGPGYFDSGFGNWLPSEERVECERCCGDGEIEAITCPGCNGPMDAGKDPYCPRCKWYLSEFEAEGVA